MANLYGRLQGSRKEVTRTGHDAIQAKLETWEGSISVTLLKNGEFRVYIGDKSHPRVELASGNINDRPLTWDAQWTDDRSHNGS